MKKLHILTLLTSAAVVAANFRPFKFRTGAHYTSRIELTDCDVTVPMVVNKDTDEVVRVLPYGSFATKKHLPTEAEKDMRDADVYPPQDKNVVQIFTGDLKRHHEKPLGPCDCPTQDIGLYYEEPVSSASSSSTSSSSSSLAQAVLVSSCASAVTQSNYPSLHLKCPSTAAGGPILKTVTLSNGETFVLYNDHLDVLDAHCNLVRTLPSFDFDVQTWTTAQDMIVEETRAFMIIAFDGFYAVALNCFTFDIYIADYFFDGPVKDPFVLLNSAMTLPNVYYFRFYYQNHTWWAWFTLYYDESTSTYKKSAFTVKSTLAANDKPGFGVVRDVPQETAKTPDAPVSPAKCVPLCGMPAVFNDYINHVDIIIGKVPACNTLHIFTSKAVTPYTSVKQCQDLHYSDRITGTPIPLYTAKHPAKNSLYLGFSTSLDLLNILYDLE